MIKKFLAGMLVFALAFSTSFSTYASAGQLDPAVPGVEKFTKEELEAIDQMAKEIEANLELYFGEIGQLTDDGYQITDIERFNQLLAEKDETALSITEILGYQTGDVQALGAKEFATCVVNKFVGSYGSVARVFTTGAIYSYIKAKQYNIAAQQIAKVLMKAGFKVNAAGLAVEIGVFAWQCRGKW